MTVVAKITNGGSWVRVSIVSETQGHSQILEGGKWVNRTVEPETFEEEILTFGKHFESETAANKFVASKAFKVIFKGVQKTWL